MDGRGCGRVRDTVDDHASILRLLSQRKYALAIMVELYKNGAACTSEVIETTGGHPKAVIDAIRLLERRGVLMRSRDADDGHKVRSCLTLLGVQLVETPVHRWDWLLWRQQGKASVHQRTATTSFAGLPLLRSD